MLIENNLVAELESNSPVATPAPAPSPTPTPEEPTPSDAGTDGNPSDTPVDAATPDEVTPPVDAPTEPKLYDLPDGRKVPAEVLAAEFREKFLPDYTRKSQELARYKKTQPITNPQSPAEPKPVTDEKPWEKPDWQPQNWQEVIQIAEERAFERLTEDQRSEIERKSMVEAYVNSQLDEVKTLDPKVDEGLLFAHAQKYGFDNLKSAYINMKEMQAAIIRAEQNAIKNINTRKAEPISTGTAPKVDDGTVDPGIAGQFSSAAEALRFFKK